MAKSERNRSLQQRLEAKLQAQEDQPATASSGKGFGRVIVAIYAILAISATARGAWQLLDHGAEAPLAYSLSLFAGIIYLVATLALAKGTGRWRLVAWLAVSFELLGVLAVGISSFAAPGSFPDQTVWSNFGQGYGYIPVVLPIVGLIWLARTKPHPAAARLT